jgi:hypothetical protein
MTQVINVQDNTPEGNKFAQDEFKKFRGEMIQKGNENMHIVIAIHDIDAGTKTRHELQNITQAKRSFIHEFEDPKSIMRIYPESFNLIELCRINNVTGTYHPTEPHVLIMTGLEALEQANINNQKKGK